MCLILVRWRQNNLFFPGVAVNKEMTIVLSLFRSHWLAVVYCLVFCLGSCAPVHEDRTQNFERILVLSVCWALALAVCFPLQSLSRYILTGSHVRCGRLLVTNCQKWPTYGVSSSAYGKTVPKPWCWGIYPPWQRFWQLWPKPSISNYPIKTRVFF